MPIRSIEYTTRHSIHIQQKERNNWRSRKRRRMLNAEFHTGKKNVKRRIQIMVASTEMTAVERRHYIAQTFNRRRGTAIKRRRTSNVGRRTRKRRTLKQNLGQR